MLPPRATLPTIPLPGESTLSSSSTTTVSGPGTTVGPPFIAVPSFGTCAMPLKPPSDEPIESVITRLGKRAKKRSFTGAENSAALELTASSELVSHRFGLASSVSINGRAIASPVIMMAFAFSRSIESHTPSASNRGVSITVLPLNIMPSIPH